MKSCKKGFFPERGSGAKRRAKWIRSSVFCLTLASVAFAPLAAAEAAFEGYLTLKGQKQGEIKGGVVKKGREGTIQVATASHEIVSPRDAASGLPTGKRQHKPFVITKRIDKSTPILNSMLVNNENIPEWKLEVYELNAQGVSRVAYTVKLTNANIATIKLVTDEDGNLFETITFTYQKIEWTWVDGGIMAMDDWEAPVK